MSRRSGGKQSILFDKHQLARSGMSAKNQPAEIQPTRQSSGVECDLMIAGYLSRINECGNFLVAILYQRNVMVVSKMEHGTRGISIINEERESKKKSARHRKT